MMTFIATILPYRGTVDTLMKYY